MLGVWLQIQNVLILVAIIAVIIVIIKLCSNNTKDKQHKSKSFKTKKISDYEACKIIEEKFNQCVIKYHNNPLDTDNVDELMEAYVSMCEKWAWAIKLGKSDKIICDAKLRMSGVLIDEFVYPYKGFWFKKYIPYAEYDCIEEVALTAGKMRAEEILGIKLY